MQTQTKWLLEDLKANKDAKFKVVVFHQPFWTNVVKEKGNPELVEYWKSIFEKMVLMLFSMDTIMLMNIFQIMVSII